jgi:DNA-binding transcriptional ArsR family regulator
MHSHELFAVLGDPTRLDVLNRLAGTGPATATELAASRPVSRQAIAKHLAALGSAGLVARRRVGREVKYEFDPGPLADVIEWASAVGDRWDQRLVRLQEELGS